MCAIYIDIPLQRPPPGLAVTGRGRPSYYLCNGIGAIYIDIPLQRPPPGPAVVAHRGRGSEAAPRPVRGDRDSVTRAPRSRAAAEPAVMIMS